MGFQFIYELPYSLIDPYFDLSTKELFTIKPIKHFKFEFLNFPKIILYCALTFKFLLPQLFLLYHPSILEYFNPITLINKSSEIPICSPL